jgi:hypothetical protein
VKAARPTEPMPLACSRLTPLGTSAQPEDFATTYSPSAPKEPGSRRPNTESPILTGNSIVEPRPTTSPAKSVGGAGWHCNHGTRHGISLLQEPVANGIEASSTYPDEQLIFQEA